MFKGKNKIIKIELIKCIYINIAHKILNFIIFFINKI